MPTSSYIGFTGTPVEKTDASTRAVFGDYISIYDIQRAVTDESTVQIYYESRNSELSLNAVDLPKLDAEFEEITQGEEQTRNEKFKCSWAALKALVWVPPDLHDEAVRIVLAQAELLCADWAAAS